MQTADIIDDLIARRDAEIERLRAALQTLLLRYELDTDWDSRNENAVEAAKAAIAFEQSVLEGNHE